MNTALLAVFDSIENFLATISDALEFDILMWVFLGVFGFLVILSLIRLRFTYEVRAIKSFKKINKYYKSGFCFNLLFFLLDSQLLSIY